jgi:hypothetical protein
MATLLTVLPILSTPVALIRSVGPDHRDAAEHVVSQYAGSSNAGSERISFLNAHRITMASHRFEFF